MNTITTFRIGDCPPGISPRRSEAAFTLVELLVVISIIGVLSALIIGGINRVSPAKAVSTTQAKRAQLEATIESYRNDRGSYPPDNPTNPGTNTLFYELTGVVFTNNLVTPASATFTSPLAPSVNLNSNTLWTVFRTYGIANAVPPGRQPKGYFVDPIAGRDYREVPIVVGFVTNFVVLLTPHFQPNPTQVVTWRYDASSNNRRNRATYDLWVDLQIKGQTKRIGN